MTKISVMNTGTKNYCIWCATGNGHKLAKKIKFQLPETEIFLNESINDENNDYSYTFKSLSEKVSECFTQYRNHLFIMSAGIVVRVISKYLNNKMEDPAVVVMDDRGDFAISLLSGHVGGANLFAEHISRITGSIPVITTATDVNKLPAIDMIAKKNGLIIENPAAIKSINMSFIKYEKFQVNDPYNIILNDIPEEFISKQKTINSVEVDDKINEVSCETLILRPITLTVGIGCNRGTPDFEIKEFLIDTFKKYNLSPLSIKSISTIDIKQDEGGITKLAEDLDVLVSYFNKDELDKVKSIKTPSKMVEKHTGVRSVCEAAAILASKKGKLIVSKKKTKNVTLAVARIPVNSIS